MTVLNNEIPRARILADMDIADQLPPEIRLGITKVLQDECDVVGCNSSLYACIQDHFFCEDHAEPFVLTTPETLLDQNAYRITR